MASYDIREACLSCFFLSVFALAYRFSLDTFLAIAFKPEWRTKFLSHVNLVLLLEIVCCVAIWLFHPLETAKLIACVYTPRRCLGWDLIRVNSVGVSRSVDSLNRSLICVLSIIRLENSSRDFENLSFLLFVVFFAQNTFPRMRRFWWGEGNELLHTAAPRRWQCNKVQGCFIGEGYLAISPRRHRTEKQTHTRSSPRSLKWFWGFSFSPNSFMRSCSLK